MQSRVRSGARHWLTHPPAFGRVAASLRADQHQTRGPPGLGGQLQPATGGQGQGLFRLGDDEADRGGAQRFFHAPEEISLTGGAEQVQPLAHTLRQAAQHGQFGDMGGGNPDQRAGMACRLKQCKGPPAAPLRLMHAGCAKGEGIGERRLVAHSLKLHLPGPLQRQFATSRRAGDVEAAMPRPPARSASDASPRAWSG